MSATEKPELIEIKRRCPKCGNDKYKPGGTRAMPGHDLHLRGEYLGRFVASRYCVCESCGTSYKVKIVDPYDAAADEKQKAAAAAASAKAAADQAEQDAQAALDRAKELKKRAKDLTKAAK